MSSSTSEGFLSVEDVIDLNHDYYSSHDLHSIDDDELKLFHRDLVTPAPSVYNGEDDIIQRNMFRQRYSPFKAQQRPISRGESVMLFKKINNGDEDVSFDLVSSELRDFIDTDSMSDDTFLFPIKEPKKKITPVILNYQQTKNSLVAREIQAQESRQIVPESPKTQRTTRMKQPQEYNTTQKKAFAPLKEEPESPTTPQITKSQFPTVERHTTKNPPESSRTHENTLRLSTRQNDVHGNVVKLSSSRKYENLSRQLEKPLRPFDTVRQRYDNTSRQYDNTVDNSPRQQYIPVERKPILTRRYGVVDSIGVQNDQHRQLDTTKYKTTRQYYNPVENDTARQYEKTLRTQYTPDRSRYKQYEEKPSRQYDAFENNYKSISSPRLKSANTFPSSSTEEVTGSAKQLLATIRERRKSTMANEHSTRTRERYESLAFDFKSKVNLGDGYHLRRSSTGVNKRYELPFEKARPTTRLPQRSLYH